MSIFEKRVKNRNNVITSHVNYNDFWKKKKKGLTIMMFLLKRKRKRKTIMMLKYLT